jgi:hypothetical protein
MTDMRNITRLLAIAFAAAAAGSCGDVVRQGRSPVFLVIDTLQGIRGGSAAGAPSGTLVSDVITNVVTPAPCAPTSPCPTIFGDTGTVSFRLLPKNTLIDPTSNNEVTITRYRVSYRRNDGNNVQGVDVPYGFDGAATVTIPATGTASVGFVLVRNTAKSESPLVQLRYNPGIVTAIADVTFWGRDRVGNDISATGSIQIDFGNFGD